VQKYSNKKIKNKSDLFKIVALIISNIPKSEFTKNHIQLFILAASQIPEFA
jgi:hypothetical protein